MTAISGAFELGDRVHCPFGMNGTITARIFTEQGDKIERRYRVQYNTLTRNGMENAFGERWLIPAAAPIEAYFYLGAAWELPILEKMHERAVATGREPFASREEIDQQAREVAAARAWLIQEGWIDGEQE